MCNKLKAFLIILLCFTLVFTLCACGGSTKCKVCHGSGWYKGGKCVFCNGTGYSDNSTYNDLYNFATGKK